MSTSREKQYIKDDLTVTWDKEKCIHSAICVNGLGEVFNPNQRPWIQLDAASKDQIINQINRCPSGALGYQSNSENAMNQEIPDTQVVQVEVIPNGPLALKSACTVTLPSGETIEKEKASYFCRCGGSSNKPFCDGAHKKLNFIG